jgi:hypothetical protein
VPRNPYGKIVHDDMSDRPDLPDLLPALALHLNDARPGGAGIEPLDLAGRAQLLRIARDVAHSTERQNAPLAAYLIGRFVQSSVEAGVAPGDALAEAAEVVRSLTGDAPD